MHKTAVAHRRQQEWKREIEAQNAGTQIAGGHSDGVTRAERYILKCAAVLA
jgi:hypothetical protein